jgi:uncharacterized membrane protein required for colicin V production
MSITFVDILLILIVLLSVLSGWRRGFILGLLDLARWIGSLLLGLRYYQPVARWLGSHVDWSEVWYQPVAFILVAAAAGVLIHLLGYVLLRGLPRGIHERRGNRLLGIVPGFISGLIAAAILAPLLMALPLPDVLRNSTRGRKPSRDDHRTHRNYPLTDLRRCDQADAQHAHRSV